MRFIIASRPKDWEFMKTSKEVLENLPVTWKAYPQTIEGAMSIIEMEHKELLAPNADKCKELIHLASACLYAWRMIKHVE